jgi:hypothetical protein
MRIVHAQCGCRCGMKLWVLSSSATLLMRNAPVPPGVQSAFREVETGGTGKSFALEGRELWEKMEGRLTRPHMC